MTISEDFHMQTAPIPFCRAAASKTGRCAETATPASTDMVISLLKDTARLCRERYDREFRARIPGMTRARAVVIGHLALHEGLTQARLAETLNVKPITLVRLLDKIERLGWIERWPLPGDRRAWSLRLTPASCRLLGEIRAVDRAIANDAGAGIDASSHATLIAMLTKLKVNFTIAKSGTVARGDDG